MSENRYFRHSGGQSGKASQIYKHLSSMDPDELIDELADKWDAMDDKDFDPELIDAYLEKLDKTGPLASDFNAENSLAAFQEKPSLLLEQMEPALKPSDTIPRQRLHSRFRAARLIATVVVVTLACMVTAQALGYNVFEVIARWTEETFRFTTPAQTETGAAPSGDKEYKDLKEALDAFGITESVAPTWYPSEFEMSGIKVSPASGEVKFRVTYEAEEKFMAVTIRQFESAKDASSITYEKDDSPVTPYECDGITHYLMSNNGQMRAAWTNQNMTCSISGDLSEDELKQMINSIYER